MMISAQKHLAAKVTVRTVTRTKLLRRNLFRVVLFAAAAAITIQPAWTQAPAPPTTGIPLASLKTVSVPDPPNLSDFVKDRAAAIALGKAFFWDTSVGSDGVSCASCHFNAGADSRSLNQLDPGLRAIPVDNRFTAPFKANYQLRASDFPFHRLADPNDHKSGVLFETNDITSSQGVTRQTFTQLNPGNAQDKGSDTGFKPDPIFNDGNHSVRAAEPRNTPSVINAVFNFRNFWDGRARDEFNCVTPIGDLDPTARIVNAKDPNTLQAVPCRLEHSSLASQAVGPALSDLEMSYGGRSFPLVGRKMLSFDHALREQRVDPTDSVLGSYVLKGSGKGLTPNYQTMIQAAFQPNWYNANLIITVTGTNPDGTPALRFDKPPTDNSGKGGGSLTSDKLASNQYLQIEYNFSLFWGLAIQLYESTLRADDSHFDQYFEGKYSLTDSEKLGLDVFINKGKCLACHGGAETTNASVQNVKNEKLERMLMGNNQVAVYDNGFYNTGVRMCAGLNGPCDDVGIGATIGPLNLPLSMSRYFQLPQYCGLGSNGMQTGCLNAPSITPRPEEGLPDAKLLQPDERVAVDGAFKTPGLRNVELTAPYFHNGGDLSLEQVVDFYNRGGNFPEANQANLDPNITPLGLTDAEKAGLVALMKSMTDERVRYQKAPFDHPEISVPNFGTVPAVGAAGTAAPLQTFASTLK
jgi:cytochrome c peroxidase